MSTTLNQAQLFRALMDGKKVRIIRWIEGAYWLLRGDEIVDDKDRKIPGAEKVLFSNSADWEILEEKPKIKLTPEMVGKKVRWADGQIEVILRYKSDGCYKGATNTCNWETFRRYINEDGHTSDDCHHVVEILDA